MSFSYLPTHATWLEHSLLWHDHKHTDHHITSLLWCALRARARRNVHRFMAHNRRRDMTHFIYIYICIAFGRGDLWMWLNGERRAFRVNSRIGIICEKILRTDPQIRVFERASVRWKHAASWCSCLRSTHIIVPKILESIKRRENRSQLSGIARHLLVVAIKPQEMCIHRIASSSSSSTSCEGKLQRLQLQALG